MMQSLKADRLFATLAILFSVLTLWPLLRTSFIPFHDLPDHVGLAALIWSIFDQGSLAHQHYHLQPYPVPYWTLYIFLAVSSVLMGSLWSAKLFVALCLLCLPFGVMRLLWVLGKDPKIGLLSFLVIWDFNLFWGYVSYHLGVGLVFWCLSYLVQVKDWRTLFKVTPLFLLAALTHAQSYGLLVLSAFAILPAFSNWRIRAKYHAAAIFLGGAPLIPWLLASAMRGGGGPRPDPWIKWHTLTQKLQKFFGHTVDVLPSQIAPQLSAFILIFFLAAIAILLWMSHRNESRFPRVGGYLFATGLLTYFAMPHALFWPLDQWQIYERHATFLLVVCLFMPSVRWQRNNLFLLGIAASTYFYWMSTMGQLFADFETRAAPFHEIIDAVPEDQAILTLTLQDNDRVVKFSPYNQFHAYVVAEKNGYDPYLFDNKSHPVVHHDSKKRPSPPWNQMRRFTMEKHGKHYDYIIVQGKKRDPLARYSNRPSLSVKMVKEAGRWRLYRVHGTERGSKE
jgi:hypothetical protein